MGYRATSLSLATRPFKGEAAVPLDGPRLTAEAHAVFALRPRRTVGG
jgi:hypothetical protein